jgi:hypothetical protein
MNRNLTGGELGQKARGTSAFQAGPAHAKMHWEEERSMVG